MNLLRRSLMGLIALAMALSIFSTDAMAIDRQTYSDLKSCLEEYGKSAMDDCFNSVGLSNLSNQERLIIARKMLNDLDSGDTDNFEALLDAARGLLQSANDMVDRQDAKYNADLKALKEREALLKKKLAGLPGEYELRKKGKTGSGGNADGWVETSSGDMVEGKKVLKEFTIPFDREYYRKSDYDPKSDDLVNIGLTMSESEFEGKLVDICNFIIENIDKKMDVIVSLQGDFTLEQFAGMFDRKKGEYAPQAYWKKHIKVMLQAILMDYMVEDYRIGFPGAKFVKRFDHKARKAIVAVVEVPEDSEDSGSEGIIKPGDFSGVGQTTKPEPKFESRSFTLQFLSGETPDPEFDFGGQISKIVELLSSGGTTLVLQAHGDKGSKANNLDAAKKRVAKVLSAIKAAGASGFEEMTLEPQFHGENNKDLRKVIVTVK